MNLKDFIKAKEDLNNQYRKGKITDKQLKAAMTKLRNSRDAAKKGRLEKTPLGRFVNWLTTPAPLSEIIEPLKGPRTKKRKTTTQAAASENIGARPKAKPQTTAARKKAADKTKALVEKAVKSKKPKSKQTGSQSFSSAFAAARKKGVGTEFMFKGEKKIAVTKDDLKKAGVKNLAEFKRKMKAKKG